MSNRSLTSLSLCGCGLEDASSLSTLISTHARLGALRLARNPRLGNLGVGQVCKAIVAHAAKVQAPQAARYASVQDEDVCACFCRGQRM
jgi:hypothetical protein